MGDSRQYRYNMEDFHSSLASYIKRKDKIGTIERCDKNIFEQGQKWYNSGHNFEEAEQKLKENINFIQGYDRARRIAKINMDLFNLGMKFFDDDIPFDKIPPNYMKNEHFVRGYNEALKASLQKKNSKR